MRIIIFLFVIIAFIACSPIKIAQVKSEQAQATDKGFVFENDSVKINYRFWANNGRMEFDVYNKLAIPLYIDWKTSAYIPNDKMVSYWRDETNTEAVSAGYYYRGMGVASGKMKAVRMERIGVIPPESMITQKSFILIQNYSDLPTKGEFDKNTTPLRFRNYISICSNEKFEGKVTMINNSFYINSVKTISSSKYDKNKITTGFYVSKGGPMEVEK